MQTVDFFTPVVDDPFAFGAIAAANALSDVYAMGGRPLTALSIAAFPERDFPLEWAQAIVRGGSEALARAGCALIGGHSVRDPEIKFGYAVTGLVDPARMLTNAAGQAGQVLVLTKPLGTGVIATALKAGKAPEASVAASTDSMRRTERRGRRRGARPRRPGGDGRHRLRARRPRRGDRAREPPHARDRAQVAAAAPGGARARGAVPGGRAPGEPAGVRAARRVRGPGRGGQEGPALRPADLRRPAAARARGGGRGARRPARRGPRRGPVQERRRASTPREVLMQLWF